MSLRPLVMYGELDLLFITAGQKMARSTFGTLMTLQCNGVKQQQAYVGNVAFGFVCAERTLYEEMLLKGLKPRREETVLDLCDTVRKRAKAESIRLLDGDVIGASGTVHNCDVTTDDVFYLVDDTPPEDPFVFQTPFLKQTGYSLSPVPLPISLVLIIFFFLYCILRLVRVFFPKVNYPVSARVVKFLRKPYIFSDKKARDRLRYRPLYTPEEAQRRSMTYYKQNSYF